MISGKRFSQNGAPAVGRLAFLIPIGLTLLPWVSTGVSEASNAVVQSGSANAPRSQILIPGEYWREDITTDVEDGWLALAAADSSLALLPVHAHFELRPHMSWADSPATIVSAREVEGALFLLRGVARLEPGIVQTWFRGNAYLAPGDSLPMLEPARSQYRVVAGPPVPVKKKVEGGPSYVYDLQIEDRTSGARQRLSTEGVGDLSTCIQWVGDLDRDGRIDLFVMRDVETGEATWTLLLSSYAAPPQIAGAVASFHRTGD